MSRTGPCGKRASGVGHQLEVASRPPPAAQLAKQGLQGKQRREYTRRLRRRPRGGHRRRVGKPYFVTDPEKMETALEDAYLLIYDKEISSMKELLAILKKSTEYHACSG
jgi:hypothetical protein